MKKLFLVFLASFFLAACHSEYSHKEIETLNDHARAQSATWIIECPVKKGGKIEHRECGTAVQIAAGVFLTAQHITKIAKRVGEEASFYISKGEKRVPSKEIIYQSAYTDIAFVTASTKCPCVPISPVAPKKGTKAFTAGFPLLFYRDTSTIERPFITEGRIQEKILPLDKDRYPKRPSYVTTIRLSGGNSGGGLFQRINNKLYVVGMASWGPVLRGGRSTVAYFNIGMFSTWEGLQEALYTVTASKRLE